MCERTHCWHGGAGQVGRNRCLTAARGARLAARKVLSRNIITRVCKGKTAPSIGCHPSNARSTGVVLSRVGRVDSWSIPDLLSARLAATIGRLHSRRTRWNLDAIERCERKYQNRRECVALTGVGFGVGSDVGRDVGRGVGRGVGIAVLGEFVGRSVGLGVGSDVGWDVGMAVLGKLVGKIVGFGVGSDVGPDVGMAVLGKSVGADV